MQKYHDSGTICSATVRGCPLGLSEAHHIEANSQEEFEAKLASRFGGPVQSSITPQTSEEEVLSAPTSAPLPKIPTKDVFNPKSGQSPRTATTISRDDPRHKSNAKFVSRGDA